MTTPIQIIIQPPTPHTCALLLEHHRLRRRDAATARKAIVERYFDRVGGDRDMRGLLVVDPNLRIVERLGRGLQALERDDTSLRRRDVVVVIRKLDGRRHICNKRTITTEPRLNTEHSEQSPNTVGCM